MDNSAKQADKAGLCEELLKRMDKDETGCISKAVFVETLLEDMKQELQDSSLVLEARKEFEIIMNRRHKKKNPDEDIAKLRRSFNLLAGKEGKGLPTGKLGTLIRSLGFFPTEREVEETLECVDLGKTGFVTLDEIIAFMKQGRFKTFDETELRTAFRLLDADDSGYVHADELRRALTTHGEPFSDEEVDQMIKTWDKDGDGRLDYQEFVASCISKTR